MLCKKMTYKICHTQRQLEAKSPQILILTFVIMDYGKYAHHQTQVYN